MSRFSLQSLLVFGLFWGPFLLFFIQPMVGKLVTPAFGGGAQIWCVCMLFFQGILLLGYGASVFLCRLPLIHQAWIYPLLMATPWLFWKFPAPNGWGPGIGAQTDGDLIFTLLWQLFTGIGLPCFCLSTVSSTFQYWMFKGAQFQNPYRFYGVSNLGSLGALLVYPLWVEPLLTRQEAAAFWSDGYHGFIFLLIALGVLMGLGQRHFLNPETRESLTEPLPWRKSLLWLGWSALGCGLLLTTTHHLTHDIAPIPLLWVLPLAIYLLSFILTFGQNQLYHRRTAMVWGFLLFILLNSPLALSPMVSIGLNLILLLVLTTICHGELYRLRPSSQHLTLFYWFLSLGGVLGGVFINLVVPFVFVDSFEYILLHLILLFSVSGLWIQERHQTQGTQPPRYLFHGLLGFMVLFTLYLLAGAPGTGQWLDRQRNFYGNIKIADKTITTKLDPPENAPRIGYREMSHGSTVHGIQRFVGNTLLNDPTAYYTLQSAPGRILQNSLSHLSQRRVAIIGLGAGTIATYGRQGDLFTFYELDPKVVTMAQRWFRFLGNSQGKVRIYIGDGRQQFKAQIQSIQKHPYHLIVVDAFSSDAIPLHLLTQEALKLYISGLEPEYGILAFHISNRFVDLSPVLANLAHSIGKAAYFIDAQPRHPWEKRSHYVLIPIGNHWAVHSRSWVNSLNHPLNTVSCVKGNPNLGLWSDDYSALIEVFR